MVSDIDWFVDGGLFFCLVVGEYGVGKIFFLNFVCVVVMEWKFVVVSVDLNFDRWLYVLGG